MLDADQRALLHQQAFLYLALAHGADGYLSDVELRAVVQRLADRRPGLPFAAVQDVVMEALDAYTRADDPFGQATRHVEALRRRLGPAERAALVEDLQAIAQADGLVMQREEGLLHRLAHAWEVPLAAPVRPLAADDSWGVLHDLAFIYLVLAYGTDQDLDAGETHVILQRLREWHPGMQPREVEALLDLARARYAQGAQLDQLQRSIEAVRVHLPAEQRQAVLDDLVHIANADGVFLDSEEDLINELLVAWGLDPSAAYGTHGRKAPL